MYNFPLFNFKISDSNNIFFFDKEINKKKENYKKLEEIFKKENSYYELEKYFYDKLLRLSNKDSLYILYTHFIKDIIKLLTIFSERNFGSQYTLDYNEEINKPTNPELNVTNKPLSMGDFSRYGIMFYDN